MNKKEVQKRVLQNGKPLALSKFNWDENTNTFSTVEHNLVINFNNVNNVSFNTGSDCTFNTGSDCTFNTGSYCTFDTSSDCTFTTGWDCTFKTGHGCTFNTGSCCTFDTGNNCTFTTGSYCTFTTGSDCTFNTSSRCTFKTGSYCTFDTGLNCTLTTGSYCTFNTGYNCTFNTGSDCTFNTGSYCTFDTSSDCTFTTGSCCTFDTSNNCTFKTGWDCTFNTDSDCTFDTGSDCVVIRRDIYSVIELDENMAYQLLGNSDKRYLTKLPNENDFHLDIDGNRIPYLLADGILSKIISHKGDIYKVINDGEETESYIIHSDGIYSHGSSLQEAKDDLVYKVTNRNTDDYKNYTLESILSFEESVKCYRTITGACGSGTRYFVENKLGERKEEYSINEIIQLTNGEYGNDKFKNFFNK